MNSELGTDRSLLDATKTNMDIGPAIHHAFLVRFEEDRLNREQLTRFIKQWHKMAKAHRETFPALIANIKDEELRFELVEILNEEYGNGNRNRIHARLLERVLRGLGTSITEAEETPTLPTIERFHASLLAIWGSGNPARAIGLHFGLEYLATAFQPHFARGLGKYSFLSSYDREYFDVHAEAEVRHVAYSERSFLYYTDTPNNREQLIDGVRAAETLLAAVWDEYSSIIFHAASPLSDSALRAHVGTT